MQNSGIIVVALEGLGLGLGRQPWALTKVLGELDGRGYRLWWMANGGRWVLVG